MRLTHMNWYKLKVDLLMKAQMDLSKYVIVEREHHPKNGGKPYWQKHYVLPDQVQAHDKVIGNHHNLPPGHPQHAPAPSPKKQHARSISDDIRAKVNTWQQKHFPTDRDGFYAALKKMGLTWAENANPGIHYMRAKEALARAIMSGLDPDNPTQITVSAPVATSPPVSQPSNPNNAQQSSTTKSKIDPAKVAARDFLDTDCGGDKNAFYQKLKQLGIKWKEVDHPGVNFMFASAALATAIRDGLDPKNPTNSQPTTPKDESLLEIPANATEREKNLINLINKMTNVAEIQGCARMGMVPEDERAKQFILDKLQAELAVAVVNPDDDPWFREVDDKGKPKFPKEVRDTITSEWGAALLKQLIDQSRAGSDVSYSKDPAGFGKAITDQMDIYGCKKHAIAPGFELLARFNMNQIMNPREYITGVPVKPNRAAIDVRVWDIVRSLNEAYADYTTDEYQPAYSTNLGYTGLDNDVYAKRYDINKEGFVRGLRKIAKDNPSLQSKVDEMIATYDEMMQTAGYNPHVLRAILDSSNWSTKKPDYYKVNQFGMRPCESRGEATQRVADADRLSDMVLGELSKRGYSQDSILEALQDTVINDGLNSFRIKNDSGTVDTIDFSQMTGGDGKPLIYMTKDVYWGDQLLHYTRAKYQQFQNLPTDETSSEALTYYNAAKRLSEIPEDTYKKVHELSMKLAGFKLVHNSGSDLDYSKVNINYDNWQTYQSKPVISDDSSEMDAILANLRMHKLYHDINTEIVRNISRNAASSLNDKGKDYSGNFDYYSGSIMSLTPSSDPRMTQIGNDPTNGATYTAAQLSDKISIQMDQVPGCSVEYLDQLKKYYAAPGRHPKADSFRRNWGSGTDAYLDSPLKDILYQVAQNVSEHIPATATKPTFQKLTAKRLNYVPFDFSRRRQPRLYKPTKVDVPAPDPKELKAARAKLLEKAECSIVSEPEDVCAQMRKQMLEQDFDYKRGEKTPEGTQMLGPIHSLSANSTATKSGSTYNQIPLFNTPFFRINNSNQQDNFQKKQDELKAAGSPSETYTPLELFQGTSYWSAASIIGQDGAFYMGDEIQKTGRMLGFGPYFGNKAGKTLPYVGNDSYSSRPGYKSSVQEVTKNECNGTLIMASVMRGNNYSTMGKMDANKKHLTSLSMDANPYYDSNQMGIRDWEIAVKDNDLINPHHIVDLSVRTIGYNIRRCPEGYRDMVSGRLLYDTQGVSLGMQYDE